MNLTTQFSILVLAVSLMACKENKKAKTKLPTTKTVSVKTFRLQQSQGMIMINCTGYTDHRK